MSRPWHVWASVAVVGVVVMARPAPAQEARPAAPRAVDKGLEAVRREVEAGKRQQAELFARIKDAPRTAQPQPFLIVREEPGARPPRERGALDAEDGLDAEDDRAAVLAHEPETVLREGGFDALLFGQGGTVQGERRRLERLLAEKVRQAGRTIAFSPGQREKLRLAGLGDLKRLFDRIDETRREFEGVGLDQEKHDKLFREIRVLRIQLLLGPFGGRSLFSKVHERILEEQRRGGRGTR